MGRFSPSLFGIIFSVSEDYCSEMFIILYYQILTKKKNS